MKISLVVPVFNEQDNILNFYNSARGILNKEKYSFEIVFVNDGSSDQTESIIDNLSANDQLVKALSFTRNFGKEAALIAGIDYATGDAIVPIDVDMQDPIEIIPQMIRKWEEGAQIVLAKRIDRGSDGFIKRNTAHFFYKFHNKISKPIIEENVGDFRLITREVVDHIKNMSERNLFMKGVLSWPGGKTSIVEYTRPERFSGDSKFGFWKLWNLAIEGITSFSTMPLRIWTYVGFLVAMISFFYGSYIVFRTLILGSDVEGYPSILVSILFIGGVQLIGIGVLGEYIGRIYIEVKARPRYILKNKKG